MGLSPWKSVRQLSCHYLLQVVHHFYLYYGPSDAAAATAWEVIIPCFTTPGSSLTCHMTLHRWLPLSEALRLLSLNKDISFLVPRWISRDSSGIYIHLPWSNLSCNSS